MKQKVNHCVVCREKISSGKTCDACKKIAKQEAVAMRQNVEKALNK